MISAQTPLYSHCLLTLNSISITLVVDFRAYAQGQAESNRIFYLSVPQEALLDVASSVATYAQSRRGWNRIIIEKPFGFDAPSSQKFTRYLLSKFEENQIYR